MKSKTIISAFTLLATAGVAQAANNRPNIILFLVDDMGWQDTSLPFWTEKTPFNKLYETPNMERLASQGMMFTQAYANSISSPTRCSLMTGSNLARHRVTNYTVFKDQPTDFKRPDIILPSWNYNGISPVQGVNNTYYAKTFVQILHDSGYYTIHCGKAHFAAKDTPAAEPLNCGFDVNIAGHAMGSPATYYAERNYGHDAEGVPLAANAIPGLEKYWGTHTFATEALTLEAISALNKAKTLDKPFYLYMSHYAVHTPIDKDMRFYPKYIAKGMTEHEAAYASLIEGMDKSLGDLMNWLVTNHLDKNTIVLFMSDNGGLATEPGARDGAPFTQNAPLNCGKGSLCEGGIREPMIVKWPGVVRPQTKCNDYLIIDDFFPTILEMAQVKHYKTPQKIDGISFIPMLRGTGSTAKGRSLVWNCPNLWLTTRHDGPGIGMACSIRKGEWKLIYYYDTGKKLLYNIENDISEQNDLSAQNPKIVKQLSKELGTRLRSMDAQRPKFSATGKFCPFPDEL